MNARAHPSVAFERERHWLFCDHCGAPVHFEPHSARASCGHCRAPLELRMRPEAAANRRARNEDERILILSGQDRRFLPPRELMQLFVAERIAPARESEAYAQFHALRAVAHDPAAGERLFALALALGELAIERGDGVSQRALLDSMLQASSSPRHHQVMRAQLARGALRAGLHDAAEAWLAACDPKSEDLIGDTAYRFARAYVDSARGDWAAVVRTLQAGELPLSDIYAPECAVLCANAWEKLDQRATAVDVLVSAKRVLGPIARRRIRRFIDAHPGWNACARSEPEAERRVAGMDVLPAEGSAIGAMLLSVMAVYCLLWGASAIFAFVALTYYGLDASFGEWSASLLGAGIMGFTLAPAALAAVKSARAKRVKRTRFTPCAAHVVGATQLASDEVTNESALLRLELLIVPDDVPAYYATIDSSVLQVMLSNFAPGKLLIARTNPRNPHDFVLEVM